MENGRRRIWPWIGLLVLVAVTFAIVEYVLRASDRNLASKLVSTFVSVATPATAVGMWLWASRRPGQVSLPLLERAADELAEQVNRQWKRAAAERGLMSPPPISVWWQWSRRQVTGPVAAAVGGTGVARFPPLPGMAAITSKKLRSGTLEDLLGVYGGLGSGRLVILGGPGAGKSGAAILLLLDALTHRAAFGTAEERARVPVPVLLTLHGWDPNSELLDDWLVGRLTGDYALLRAREYGRDAAARLISGGYITVILDGLDEMPEALRLVALRALDQQATFRLVLLTRSQEMVAAVSDGHLQGAAALELCSVQADQAAEYLASAQIDPAPLSWQSLLKHLRDHSGGALAQALETPLMVTLVRDIYRPGDDPVDELTDNERFASSEDIENHLLDQVLAVAYTHRPGHPAPVYSLDQARHWLGHLARRMNVDRTRDLAWWKIPHWVPGWPRVLATVVACELVVGFVISAGVGLARALVSKLGLALTIELVRGFTGTLVSKLGLALTIGLVIGFMGAFGERPLRYVSWLRRSKTSTRANLIVGLVYGFIFGLVGGFANGLVNGFPNGPMFGILVGLLTGSVVGISGTFGERSPQHLSRPRWNKIDIFRNLAVGLIVGLMVGLMYGLVTSNAFGTGHKAGFAMWVVVWLALGFVLMLGRPSAEAMSPIDPCSSLRRNRQFGLVVGLVAALAYGLWQSFAAGLAALIVSWVVAGLALGLAVGLVFPATWQVALASAQLWRRGEAPVRLIRFLEDARERQVLRTVGQVYQFRHAQLQDRLAGVGVDPAQVQALVSSAPGEDPSG
ncbi:MAG: hypothetical protein ACRDRS_03795 [Pseudonocardiaceae bacterium]